MADIGSLSVVVGAKTDDLKKALSAADKSINGFISKIKGMIGPLAGAFAIGKLFTDYIGEADSLGKFSKSIGENIQDIDAWGQAVKHAGGTSEGFQSSVMSLTRSLTQAATLGTGRAKPALDALGISAKNADGSIKKATDVLMELAEKAETMDAAEFAGVGRMLQLDQGSIMLLQQGKKGVEELTSKLKDLSYTEEDAQITAEFNDRLQDAKKAFKMLATIIFREVVPRLEWLLGKVEKLIKFLRNHEGFVKIFFMGLATVLTAKVIPAFIKWNKTMMANPFFRIIALIMLLSLVIEDLIVWANGGKSAFGGVWKAIFGNPEKAKKTFNDILDFFMNFGEKIEAFGTFIVERIISVFDGLSVIGDDITDFSNDVMAGLDFVGQGIVNFFSGIFDAVNAVLDRIMEAFRTAKQEAQTILGFITGEEPSGGPTLSEKAQLNATEAKKRYGTYQPFNNNPQSSAAVTPPSAGPTTVNSDQSVQTTVQNMTVNVNSDNPDAISKASGQALAPKITNTSKGAFQSR
jgi:hypothetical protein